MKTEHDRDDVYDRAQPLRHATELAYDEATHQLQVRWHDTQVSEWVDADSLGQIPPSAPGLLGALADKLRRR